MIPTALFALYVSLFPSMDCTSEVVCYKHWPSAVESKEDWDVIDLQTFERLETTWISDTSMQSKITQPTGEIEYFLYEN